MAIIFRCSMETRHFSFEAYGATEEEAAEALGRAITIHGAQYRLSSDWWESYEQNTQKIALGVPYRDGEELTA